MGEQEAKEIRERTCCETADTTLRSLKTTLRSLKTTLRSEFLLVTVTTHVSFVLRAQITGSLNARPARTNTTSWQMYWGGTSAASESSWKESRSMKFPESASGTRSKRNT